MHDSSLISGSRSRSRSGGGDKCSLPLDCICHVLSLTSPRDVCRSSLVSAAVRSVAATDVVWERFLPPDLAAILSRAVNPVRCSSMKELYFRLCDSILLDGGKTSFALEKSTGWKCYMLSARDLRIRWGDNPLEWRWISLSTSRFTEVAELLSASCLEIHGRISTSALSPKITYSAYLVYKLLRGSHGLDSPPHVASVNVGGRTSKWSVLLRPPTKHESRQLVSRKQQVLDKICMLAILPSVEEVEEASVLRVGRPRGDGWLELEMGELFNVDEGGDDAVGMSLVGVRGGNWMTGVIIQGIEVRPKKQRSKSSFRSS